METLFRSLPNVLFCIKDRDRRYVAANDALVAATLKKTVTEVLNRRAIEVFPEMLAAGYEQQDDEVFERGVNIEDRLEMITRADCDVGWFVSHKAPIRSRSGEVIALASISRDLEIRADDGQELGAVKEALDTLHRDYSKPLRIGDLAEKTSMSASQFERRISKITGLSPRQLLTKLRIDAAATKLRETDLSVGQIAIDTGFYDQAALTRKFREVTGLTPARYRQATTSL
ncbi:AraC family transcriptional regulator [Blastopirellula sp. J2-11]|uniref:AraC family transcriptional regulator n=1 Tax=Blastopirellula sp. J2-11 TaxID=2943192 RepID=UPI0021C70A63|nr:AraC family transcriptional regulator [Blastopirellula sp. J2-11]UUO05518.1 AraC family transcriptional regulator [Blastopirellula sp. J2-11]